MLQASNDPKLMKKRMLRYLVPVLLLSITINISKFFEAYVSTNEDGNYIFEVSQLRRNAIYSAITNWMRLVLMSALPLIVIIFFNYKIYKDVKERSERSFEQRTTRNYSPETKV